MVVADKEKVVGELGSYTTTADLCDRSASGVSSMPTTTSASGRLAFLVFLNMSGGAGAARAEHMSSVKAAR